MMQTPEEFLKANGFVLAADIDRQALIGLFLSEMEKGLKGEVSSLPMIPAYLGVSGKVPTGVKAAVLDAGGTNFRSALVSIPPKIEMRENRPMPGSLGPVDEESFYEAFASDLKRVADHATAKKFGWCFSYCAEVTPNLDARLKYWTKGIQAPAIVGELVGEELLKRMGGGQIAVLNDTVATLLAAKAMEGEKTYSSYIGFILGTGTNTAYVEKNANITKIQGLDPDGALIINAESAAMDKMPRSKFDVAVDLKQPDPGRNLFERMISGGYLGALGLEVFKGAAKVGLFSPKAAALLGGLGALETIDLDDFLSGRVREGRANPLAAAFANADDAKMAHRLARPVFERAAMLTAIHLAAFCIKSGEGTDPDAPIAIQVDGSTYYKTRAIDFSQIVRRELDDMLVRRRNIHYVLTPPIEDAPIVGAAIAALL